MQVYLLSALGGVFGRQQFFDRDIHKVWICRDRRAIRKSHFHHLREQVDALFGSEADGFQIKTLEHIQHLSDVQRSCARWWRTDDFKTAVIATQCGGITGVVAA